MNTNNKMSFVARKTLAAGLALTVAINNVASHPLPPTVSDTSPTSPSTPSTPQSPPWQPPSTAAVVATAECTSLRQASPALQLIVGTLCFTGVLQSAVYAFTSILKTVSAARPDHATRASTLVRKCLLVLGLVGSRVVVTFPLALIVLDWTTAAPSSQPAVSPLAVSRGAVWVYVIVGLLATIPQVADFCVTHGRRLVKRGFSSRQRLDVPGTLLPDTYVVLTVEYKQRHALRRVLSSLLTATSASGPVQAGTARQTCVVVVFDRHAYSAVDAAFMAKILGVHAMAPGRPYATRAGDVLLVCLWSRSETCVRGLQRQGLQLVRDMNQRRPARLDDSVVVLADCSAVLDGDTVARGVGSLAIHDDIVAVCGWRRVAPSAVGGKGKQGRQSDLMTDADSLLNALFQKSLENSIGIVSDLDSAATFVRYSALKTIEREYFVHIPNPSTRDYHLIDADWSKYLSTILQEQHGPQQLQFDFYVAPAPAPSAESASLRYIRSFWSTLSNRVSLVVHTPNASMASLALVSKTVWLLLSAETSVPMVACLALVLSSAKEIPVAPMVLLAAVVMIKWVLALAWCGMNGRPGLGLYVLPHILIVQPLFSLSLLFASFFTWMMRFEPQRRPSSHDLPHATVPSNPSSASSPSTITPTWTPTTSGRSTPSTATQPSTAKQPLPQRVSKNTKPKPKPKPDTKRPEVAHTLRASYRQLSGDTSVMDIPQRFDSLRRAAPDPRTAAPHIPQIPDHEPRFLLQDIYDSHSIAAITVPPSLVVPPADTMPRGRPAVPPLPAGILGSSSGGGVKSAGSGSWTSVESGGR
ncbi:hypothetical protein BC831DRAFT_552789 [Entophlyctis helioformis]|nr:hypothetical protein BC831DRAFT_552789 [Entophlyctis helioformis]